MGKEQGKGKGDIILLITTKVEGVPIEAKIHSFLDLYYRSRLFVLVTNDKDRVYLGGEKSPHEIRNSRLIKVKNFP